MNKAKNTDKQDEEISDDEAAEAILEGIRNSLYSKSSWLKATVKALWKITGS